MNASLNPLPRSEYLKLGLGEDGQDQTEGDCGSVCGCGLLGTQAPQNNEQR